MSHGRTSVHAVELLIDAIESPVHLGRQAVEPQVHVALESLESPVDLLKAALYSVEPGVNPFEPPVDLIEVTIGLIETTIDGIESARRTPVCSASAIWLR